MRAYLAYTAARLGLFALTYGLLVGGYVLVRGTPVPVLWPLVVAALVSSVLAAVLLRDLREQLIGSVQERASRAASSSGSRAADQTDPPDSTDPPADGSRPR